MSYYKPCPHCGSNLDPGESCDCREKDRLYIQMAQKIHDTAARNNVPVASFLAQLMTMTKESAAPAATRNGN